MTRLWGTEFRGKVTVALLGDQAVALRFVILCTARLPLVVWIPRRHIGWVLVGCWLLLMDSAMVWVTMRAAQPSMGKRTKR